MMWRKSGRPSTLNLFCLPPQVPPNQHSALDSFLEKLGYAYHQESDNPNYLQFFREDASTK